MECRNCPYIKDEFDKRMDWYQKRVDKSNIYGNMTYANVADYEEQYCWCEKTGGKLNWYGQCGDAYSNGIKHKSHSNKKKRNKRERDFKHKQHLKYIANNSSGHPFPAFPVDKYGEHVPGKQWYVWFPDDEPQEIAYDKRRYRSNGSRSASNYHQKMSNRKIRRYKDSFPKGFLCHRLYDYWYEMY